MSSLDAESDKPAPSNTPEEPLEAVAELADKKTAEKLEKSVKKRKLSAITEPVPRPQRERKTVKLFNAGAPEKAARRERRISAPTGESENSLGKFEGFNNAVRKMKADDQTIIRLHRILFKVPGAEKSRKSNLKRWSGVSDDESEAEKPRMAAALSRLTKTELIEMNKLFGVCRKSDTKGEMEEILVKAFLKPSAETIHPLVKATKAARKVRKAVSEESEHQMLEADDDPHTDDGDENQHQNDDPKAADETYGGKPTDDGKPDATDDKRTEITHDSDNHTPGEKHEKPSEQCEVQPEELSPSCGTANTGSSKPEESPEGLQKANPSVPDEAEQSDALTTQPAESETKVEPEPTNTPDQNQSAPTASAVISGTETSEASGCSPPLSANEPQSLPTESKSLSEENMGDHPMDTQEG